MNRADVQLLSRLILRRGWKEPALLIAVVLIASILELFGVSVLYWFVKFATDPNIEANIPKGFPDFFVPTENNPSRGIVLLGLLIIVVYIVKAFIGFLAVVLRVRFSSRQAERLAREIMMDYAARPYEQYLGKHTADQIRKVFAESDILGSQVLLTSVTIISESFFSLILILFLLWYDPVFTTILVGTFGVLYYALYSVFRSVLAKAGAERQRLDRERVRSALEFFGGLKEVKLSGNWGYFVRQFTSANWNYVRQLILIYSLPGAPSFLMQVLATTAVVSLLIIGTVVSEAPISDVLAAAAVFAAIGWRMMPSLNAIVRDALLLRGHIEVLWKLREDIEREPCDTPITAEVIPPLDIEREIALRNIDYCYPQSSKNVVKNLNMVFPLGESIGIVGPSGAGKSTIAELLLGLLTPRAGSLTADGNTISQDSLESWQRTVGYVPQRIYIADDTLLHNVAFGTEHDEIDVPMAIHALTAANLTDFVDELPEGIDSQLGERGTKISGGQMQRIGIARAIYKRPSLLVLDEATSALDTHSERKVSNAIRKLGDTLTTVIIAHRLTTVRHCDRIYVINDGAVVDVGSYTELLERCDLFKQLTGDAHDMNIPDSERQ